MILSCHVHGLNPNENNNNQKKKNEQKKGSNRTSKNKNSKQANLMIWWNVFTVHMLLWDVYTFLCLCFAFVITLVLVSLLFLCCCCWFRFSWKHSTRRMCDLLELNRWTFTRRQVYIYIYVTILRKSQSKSGSAGNAIRFSFCHLVLFFVISGCCCRCCCYLCCGYCCWLRQWLNASSMYLLCITWSTFHN